LRGANVPNLPVKPSESGRWRSRGGRCSGTAVRVACADARHSAPRHAG